MTLPPSLSPLQGHRPLLLLALAGLAQRLFFFLEVKGDLDAVLAENADYLSWQFLSLPALRDHLGDSLLYLQQSPPLPNLLLGLILQVAQPPFALAYTLLALEAVISIASSWFFFSLLEAQLGRRGPALIFASLFLLGPDLLLLEYNSFGQSFYEHLTQLLLLALLVALARWLGANGGWRYASWTGLAAGLLPLARSTFSYFSFVFLAFLLLTPLRHRRRQLALCAALTVGLPLSWSMKQLAVYGDLRIATSTWAGGNAVQGLVKAGFETPLREFLAADAGRYPPYFIRLVEQKGLVDWRWEPQNGDLPPEILQRDRLIQERLFGTNRKENGVAQAAVFAVEERLWRNFLLAHPRVGLAKLHRSLKLFFFPIRYHAAPFLSSEWVIDPTWPPWKIVAMLLRGELPEKTFLYRGTWPAMTPSRQIELPTFDKLSILWQSLLFWGLLLLVPLRLLMLLHGLGQAPTAASWLWLAAGLAAAYVMVLANLVEYGENQRFRLAVEPLLWLLVLAAASEIARKARPWCRRKLAA